MFYKTTEEIIDKIDNLNQERKSIIELDLIDIKDDIEKTIFTFSKKEDELDKDEKVTLGLLFLSYISIIKDELSYNGLWLDIIDVLLENEDENRFFIDNFFIDENEPSIFLIEAIKEAIISFDLRDGYDDDLIKTILLQIGLLSKFNHINLWLTNSSKQYIIEELTNRNHINFSNSFYNGWRCLQKYRYNTIDKKSIYKILKNNIWFKDLNIDNLLELSKKELSLINIAKEDIDNNFYIDKILFENEILNFYINIDEVLDLEDENYNIFINDIYYCKLLKNNDIYKLEKNIIITNPTKLTIDISIKEISNNKNIYFQEFTLFDFNQDTIIFDQNGKWTDDKNTKLDKNNIYNVLIDSDFDIEGDNLKEYEYFDGYANLITNITNSSNFYADDGDNYKFELNFDKIIKRPILLNNLELFAQSEFLSFDEQIKYQLKNIKLSSSVRVDDKLVNIEDDIEILRWTYSDGVIYDFENSKEFNYNMDISYEILVNRKNTFQIKIGDYTFTKVLYLSLIEETTNPQYRIFLKDKTNNIELITKNEIIDKNFIENNNFIVTSFHPIFLTKPELNKQYLRDKANIFTTIKLNKIFKIDNYPYFGEEISTSLNIYDDVRWNLIGKITRYSKKDYNKNDNIKVITLDNNYKLNIQNDINISENILGYCVIKDNCYDSSYFIDNNLDIDIIFKDKEILKFLRFSYFEFGEYFNEAKFDKSRALREKARNDKKKAKRLLRENILQEPFVFLDAFLADKFDIEDLSLEFNFDESKTIIEQILFTIEFDENIALKIVQYSILNQLQEKMMKIPMFLIYILNKIKNEKYIDIYMDEINLEKENNINIDEEFYNRMVSALLSDHKIDRYEKINIKTISQTDIKDNLIKDSLVLLHK